MSKHTNTNESVNGKKILYFEGAGSATPETIATGVGNCRIRTAFHMKDGRPAYLEISSCGVSGRKNATTVLMRGIVDYAHWITDGGDDCNKSRITGIHRSGQGVTGRVECETRGRQASPGPRRRWNSRGMLTERNCGVK